MRARLIVEAGDAKPPVCDLSDTQESVRLGRNRNNTIVLQDQHASRWHAEVFLDDGRWYIRDCGATNGTKINGERISCPTPLENGNEIAIGDSRLRFTTDPAKEETAEMKSLGTAEAPRVPAEGGESAPRMPPGVTPPPSDHSQTRLHADELTALFRFMADSLQMATPHELVGLALKTVYGQTMADVAGFLSLDAEEPQFRIVFPDRKQAETHLSRKLTDRVLRDGQSVWLGSNRGDDLESDSLMAFRDVVCIPLRVGPGEASPPAPREPPLGALHVYKSNRLFTEREVRFCEVLAGCLASTLDALRSRRALEADNSRLRVRASASGDVLIGDSPKMQRLRQQITRVAACPCTVLIVGESGVGKELVAVGLHQQSQRHAGPLVPLNCAAVPSGLIEAELFGHKKGAFTGAVHDRQGHFLRADEGTLFLDEIGDLPPEAQAKLLRVLETRSVPAVGSDDEIKVDVRIVAATNRDLERDVREGRFRKDLFFRLGTRINVPPLRDHMEDLPALAEHFLRKLNAEYRRRVILSHEAMRRLQNYSWPGNVRQLRSVLETAVAMNESGTIHATDLHLIAESGVPTDGPASLNLKELEAWAIRQALARTGGNNTQAARLLGIHRDTLIAKLKSYGIERTA